MWRAPAFNMKKICMRKNLVLLINNSFLRKDLAPSQKRGYEKEIFVFYDVSIRWNYEKGM